jgi:hypothetical protein
MAPPQHIGGLSPSAQIVRNVFTACISSLEDLSEPETTSVAASSAADLIDFIATETVNPPNIRAALQGLSDLCRSHIQVIDQSSLPEPANQNG